MRIALPLVAAVVIGAAACGPRQVEVRTAPTQATQLAVQVTNNLSQSVNVYAVASGTESFLRQVRANSSETIPLQGFAAGSSISLKAVTVDGKSTYNRANVVLSGTYAFAVP